MSALGNEYSLSVTEVDLGTEVGRHLASEASVLCAPGVLVTVARFLWASVRAQTPAALGSPPRREMTTGLRRTAGLLGIVVALAVLGLQVAGPAAAHPTLLFTEPVADSAVSVAPEAIALKFNESVSIGPDAIVLLDENGRTVATSQATTSDGAQVVTARPAAPVTPGSYTVRWRVTGTDGDLVEEEFRFGVGYALTATAADASTESTAWWSAALRWGLFAGFAIAFGGLIAQRFIASARADKPLLVVPRSPVTGALAAALGATAGLASQVIAEAGQASALWRTAIGAIVLAEAAGLLAALALTRVRRQTWALVPLLVIVGAEGWRSHAHSTAGWWGRC